MYQTLIAQFNMFHHISHLQFYFIIHTISQLQLLLYLLQFHSFCHAPLTCHTPLTVALLEGLDCSKQNTCLFIQPGKWSCPILAQRWFLNLLVVCHSRISSVRQLQIQTQVNTSKTEIFKQINQITMQTRTYQLVFSVGAKIHRWKFLQLVPYHTILPRTQIGDIIRIHTFQIYSWQ